MTMLVRIRGIRLLPPSQGAVHRPRVAVFFFFQAEDGIRDADVTGVQTCALPISLPLALRPVLRRADEHFDQIIVQSVVELTLEGPFKLWMIEVAGMKFEIISMHRDRRIFELNNDFYPIAFATCREH